MEHVQIYFKNFNKIIKITGITNFLEFFSFYLKKMSSWIRICIQNESGSGSTALPPRLLNFVYWRIAISFLY